MNILAPTTIVVIMKHDKLHIFVPIIYVKKLLVTKSWNTSK